MNNREWLILFYKGIAHIVYHVSELYISLDWELWIFQQYEAQIPLNTTYYNLFFNNTKHT